MVGDNQVKSGASLRVVFIVPMRIVPASAFGDLLGRQPKEKDIVFARSLGHLDRRPVACTDGKRAIHHELHIARAARFITRGRKLVGDITCRDQMLRERHAIIGKKQNTQAAFDCWVGVDGSRKIVNEFDNKLRKMVSGRSLAGEEERARRHVQADFRAGGYTTR